MAIANPTRPLHGRTALVTGSGRNIGRAIALGFARDGANVVLNGHHDRSALEAVARAVNELGAEAQVAIADVSDPDAVSAMVTTAIDRFGAVDIAVSNVSLRLHQPLLEISVADWDRILRTNLSASFYLARAVLPAMQARRWGRIVHLSGRDGFSPKPNRAHNVTAKAGVFALAKAIAVEFGVYGITANAIAPGIVETTRDADHYPDARDATRPDSFEARRRAMPMQRFGRVEEIAAACSYLCSDLGSFTTGQILHVNGGEFMF